MTITKLMENEKLKDALEYIQSHKNDYEDFSEEGYAVEKQGNLLSISIGNCLYGLISFEELLRRYILLLDCNSQYAVQFLDNIGNRDAFNKAYEERLNECVDIQVNINKSKIKEMLNKDIQPFFDEEDLYKRISIDDKEYILYDFDSAKTWARHLLYVD